MPAAGDDIAVLTAQLARDPSSLVFLPLAEALRRGGDLAAALLIAENGVAWYPEMAGAWDLLARVQSDRGEGDLAFDAWTTVLRLDPDHPGAPKGLAFLSFRAGDLVRSLRYLRRAVELAPGDAALPTVLERVHREVNARRLPLTDDWSPLTGQLLVDLQGRLLAGRLENPAGHSAGEAVGAVLAGIAREAERTVRLLGLGPWQKISIVGIPAGFEVRAPTVDSVLLVTRPCEVPQGRLALEADRTATAARRWLEEL